MPGTVESIHTDDSERTGPVNAHIDDVINNEYRLVELISSGMFGEVWCTRVESTGQLVALKAMFTIGKSIQASRARHIGELLGLSYSPDARLFSGTIDSVKFLNHDCNVFELHGMSMRDVLNRQCMLPLPSFQSRAITWQLCSGIAFLHNLGIAHTDIKPENILFANDATMAIRDIDAKGRFYDKIVLRDVQIKIIDLEDSVDKPQHLHYIHGTAGYHSPEIYGETGWSFPVDVFAIGCVTFELFTGHPLLPDTSDVREYLFCVERSIGRFSIMQVQDISRVHPDVFQTKTRIPRVRGAAISTKARNRLNKYIQETKWQWKALEIPDVRDFIKLCTVVDPHRRLNADSTTQHRMFYVYSNPDKR